MSEDLSGLVSEGSSDYALAQEKDEVLVQEKAEVLEDSSDYALVEEWGDLG